MKDTKSPSNVPELFASLKRANMFLVPKQYRKLFFTILFFETIIGQVWVVSALSWAAILDLISENQQKPADPKTLFWALLGLVAVFHGIVVVRSMCNTYKDILLNRFNSEVSQHAALLFTQTKMKWELYDRQHPDSRNLIDNAVDNYGSTAEMFSEQRVVFQNLITFCIALIGILTIKWWYVLFAIVSVVPSMIFYYRKNKQNHERRKRIVETKRYSNYLGEKVTETWSRLNNKVDDIWPKFQTGMKWSKRFDHLFYVSVRKYGWVFMTISIFFGAIVSFHATYQTVLGLITLGTLNLVFNYFGRIADSLWSLSDSVIGLMKNVRKVEEFFKFIDFKSTLIHKEDSFVIEHEAPLTIEFRNVYFRYPTQKEDKWALEDVSFVIANGERIGLLGENGSGKSTIVQLLLRLYDPTQGDILVNGVNLKEVDRKSYYRQFGVLEQDFSLTLGMFKNIIKGDQPFDQDRIEETAKQADIHERIMQTPDGYMSNYGYVFNKGVRLSMGEEQKLALASVMYRNPNIIVLDEPTASMSTLAEQRIFEEYNRAFSGKTLIMVSHRFRSLDQVNRILLFESGKVVADGTHEVLMETNEKYKEMFLAGIPEKHSKVVV
jgi:ATP-binding cassette subfamily B protein